MKTASFVRLNDEVQTTFFVAGARSLLCFLSSEMVAQ